MANLLYVDNSNVWIEGLHVAAHAAGMTPDVWTAVKNNICDHGWKLDFGKLFAFAGGDKSEVKKAALFGSRPPKNDSLWDAARRKGFEVIVYDRNIVNHEKKIDTDIVATMITDSYEILKVGQDEITLVRVQVQTSWRSRCTCAIWGSSRGPPGQVKAAHPGSTQGK